MNRVVNTTVLSNFAAVGRLDLLRDTIGLLYLPTKVYIGVLLLAVQDGRLTLDEGNALLRQMIVQANYRSPTLDLGPLLP